MTRDTFYDARRFRGPGRFEAFLDVGYKLHDEIMGRSLTDPEATIANLLEEAFQAGRDVALAHRKVEPASGLKKSIASSPEKPGSPIRRMTEDDLPAMPLRSLSHFTRAVGRTLDKPVRRPPTSEGLVLIMRPAVPGLPPSMTRDQWFYCYSGGDFGWGNPTILPLIKLGLYEQPIDLRDGWKVTYMTEWGFELFLTGETSLPGYRMQGGSSTFEQYSELLWDRRELFLRVGRSTGLVKESPVAIEVDHDTSRRRF